MKDNFSRQSDAYAKFRPAYPPELYDFIFEQVDHFDRAWDCGTGNGQVAAVLAEHFREVRATDISRRQLDQAVQKPNIHYSLQSSETANFPENYFDLITVGQAVHWFDHERYYAKAQEVLRPGGILAEFGYPLFRATPDINEVMDHFYQNIVGSYWDPERWHIDESYARIPFPFETIPAPDLYMTYEWTFPHLIGYLSTWSSVQHYIRENGEDPIAQIREDLEKAWPDGETLPISYKILLRVGRG